MTQKNVVVDDREENMHKNVDQQEKKNKQQSQQLFHLIT